MLLPCTKHKLTSINKQLVLVIYHVFCADKAKKEMKKLNVGEMVDGDIVVTDCKLRWESWEDVNPTQNLILSQDLFDPGLGQLFFQNLFWEISLSDCGIHESCVANIVDMQCPVKRGKPAKVLH